MPLDASPSAIMNALRYRRESKRRSIIELSVTISNLVLGGFSDRNTDPLNAIRHLYSDDEWQQLQERREEQEELRAQQMQIAKLMRLGR